MKIRPHYLLNRLAGWRAAPQSSGVAPANCLTLQPLPGSGRPLVDAAGSLGGFQSAIGVAVDSQDRVYCLDGAACELKRFDRCHGEFVTLPCIGGHGPEPRRFCAPHGLAISAQDNLYVADTGNRRVQVFSASTLALRHILGPLQVTTNGASLSVAAVSPVGNVAATGTDCHAQPVFPPRTWQPWDVALSGPDRAYVSDYVNGLVHVFDCQGAWRGAYNGAGASEGATYPALVKPTRLAVDCDGRIYVLQENISYVVVLSPEGQFVGVIQQPGDLAGRFCPSAVAVDINGNLCLSDCVTRKFYFYQPNGDGGWCGFRCVGCATGFAASLIFDRSGHAVYADGAQRVCQLTQPANFPTQGAYYSEALDSKTYRCVWHRVALAASVPAGASIQVDTFTSEALKTDDEVAQPGTRWGTSQVDSDTDSNRWDCLIQSPPGRYLWLRLTLTGDGSVTPAIESVKAYYPRASSLQYLPAVYRQDPAGGDFLDRFLSVFDTVRGGSSAKISTMARYFDPLAAPANPPNTSGTDFLSWLASWLGLSLQSNWPVRKRRKLVRQAHRLFALRGTPAGLRLHVELYAGLRAHILENFRLRRMLFVDSSRLGDCSTLFGASVMNRLQIGANSTIGSFQLVDSGNSSLDVFNAYANQFVVVVPRWPGATSADQQALEQIIDMAKPAHTLGVLQWADPRLRVGLQSFVGVDTVIGRYPLGVIEGQGALGYDTVLGEPGAARPAVTVGRHSRLGCDRV